MKLLRLQIGAELRILARNGEQLLLILGIPMLLLAFFSKVEILPTGGQESVDFLLPGIIALAVMSTSMVSLGIATGFERSYSVLKRLGATPLGTWRLVKKDHIWLRSKGKGERKTLFLSTRQTAICRS